MTIIIAEQFVLKNFCESPYWRIVCEFSLAYFCINLNCNVRKTIQLSGGFLRKNFCEKILTILQVVHDDLVSRLVLYTIVPIQYYN